MIDCPLLKKKIGDEDCFDIQMCAEHMAPKDANPEKVKSIKDYEQICLNCKNHDK